MRRSANLTPDEWATVDAFHRLYYEGRQVGSQTWLGVYVLKHPFDLLTYQEVLVSTRPDWIIETGTAWGGSALYFATICDLLNHGQVCSIDAMTNIPALYRWAFGEDCQVPTTTRPAHTRITYLQGNTADPHVARQAQSLIHGRVMVTLDSAHDAGHVMQELTLYAPLVTPGCYLVVEDTNMGGHPVQEPPWEGPWEATEAFLLTHPEFTLDACFTERHLMSYNTWLIRT
jgi:cephalosporin hydroxylase